MDETGCHKTPEPLFFKIFSDSSDIRKSSPDSVISSPELSKQFINTNKILSSSSEEPFTSHTEISSSLSGKQDLLIKKGSKKIQCLLCPHNCIISENKSGICLVRGNKGGKPAIPFYGKLSALAMDPIEKKPLYHFYPGSSILSAGFFGCNLKCPFCQNFSISSKADISYRSYSPEEILSALKEQGGIGLAYTYSEPAVHIEWIAETAELLHKNGYKNVLVTNGMINNKPADYLLENIDAANIDLKSHNPDFYKNELKGNLETVKNFILKAASKIHVEITTLVIPGKNDSDEEIMKNADFIASISKNIPYHLSCYFPSYKYTAPPTPVNQVLKLAELSKKKLNFVYTGNTGLSESDTFCPSCGELLVKRNGYSAYTVNLKKDKCRNCGYDAGIII